MPGPDSRTRSPTQAVCLRAQSLVDQSEETLVSGAISSLKFTFFPIELKEIELVSVFAEQTKQTCSMADGHEQVVSYEHVRSFAFVSE
jgi:hypothetical protein